MLKKNQIFNIGGELLSDEELSELDRAGYCAIDAWNDKTARDCLFSLDIDPWDHLTFLRANLKKTKLRVTLRGQALLGKDHFSDEIVEAFTAALAERHVDILRIYDALNDPRNLETPLKSAKKYGVNAEAAMIYAESPVYSPAFFAGYAAQLAAMGADSIAICSLTDRATAYELVKAVKNAVKLPLTVSAPAEYICDAALEAGADFAELCEKEHVISSLSEEIETIRAEAGFPPLAEPIMSMINIQALANISRTDCPRYEKVTDEFKALILGRYGKTPAPIDREFVKRICGEEPLVLVRPADLIEPDYDRLRSQIAPYFEAEEDILTYAVFGEQVLDFFRRRMARKYGIDMHHSDPARGIHTV